MDGVDLFGEFADVGQCGAQDAEGGEGGGCVFGRDFAQNVFGGGGFGLCFFGGVFFFDGLRQRDAFGWLALCFVFLFFQKFFAVDDAQVVVGGEVHQETEHLRIVFFEFLIDGDAADVVHQHGAHPVGVGQPVVFGE